MKPTCAVIPAGGRGTRLQPLTYAVPKELFPLGPYPTIQHVTQEITAAGITDILVITGPEKRLIEDHLDEVKRRGETEANFAYVSQEEPLGLGDAVLCTAPVVGERPFVVALGDGVITGPAQGGLLERMMRLFETHEADAVISVERVSRQDTGRYGICVPSAELEDCVRLSDLVEKPDPEQAPSRLAICGRYIFTPTIFERIGTLTPGAGGEIQLTDAIADLARSGGRVLAVPLKAAEHRLDVGNPSSYYEAVDELAGDM